MLIRVKKRARDKERQRGLIKIWKNLGLADQSGLKDR